MSDATPREYGASYSASGHLACDLFGLAVVAVPHVARVAVPLMVGAVAPFRDQAEHRRTPRKNLPERCSPAVLPSHGHRLDRKRHIATVAPTTC